MANILRVKASWTGFVGAPGFSVFHFTTVGITPDGPMAAAACGQVRTFFDAIKAHLAPPVTVQVVNEAEEIDETNGALVNIHNAGTVLPVTSTGTAGTGYAAPSGAVVTWRTSGIVNNRRVQGKTFLVPLISTSYQSDGSINPTALGVINTAADGLVQGGFGTEPIFGVWSRPVEEDPNVPGVEARLGSFHIAEGFRTPDMAAVLRSRRD